MKAFTTLALLLRLLPLVWICSGQEPVLVDCSYFNFRAIAKRALFYSDELVGPDELFLGTGCQAIHVRPDELEFDYPITLCGIVLQVFFDRTVFHSWLTYTPRNGLFSAELHLECIVPSLYSMPDNSGISAELIQYPSLQHWFLIRQIYCGCAYFRDNWSTPFYGAYNHSVPRRYYSSFHLGSLEVWRCHNNMK